MEEASRMSFHPALRRAFGVTRGALALLGLAVSFALAVPSVRDSIFQPPAISLVTSAVLQPHQPTVLVADVEPAVEEHNPEQRALAEFIAKKYRVEIGRAHV